ncbi:hybrid sensor histidine kinase/response regulator [Bacterioplanes sanyensis]|uniref:Sensory/regulatory protein RpfC n=1 Tax=Bacterioplanes sanyensis TaxID=1249553 RepID=A0A222FLK7_9GAMM|nr:PAS domain S-box protein [Bacterioplanes sanyensis]ASP39660.1 hybrid sensor histidine kinase/response regulator [Bacterioplanes sanyensis]
MSLRIKLVLGIALIESMLLVVLIISALNMLSHNNEQQLHQRADVTMELLSILASDPARKGDAQALQQLAQSFVEKDGVALVQIHQDAEVLAQAGEVALLDQSTDAQQVIMRQDIHQQDRLVAHLVVAITANNLLSGSQWLLSIAGVELVLIALLAFLGGSYLTRQFHFLKNASALLNKGDVDDTLDVPDTGAERDLAQAFNRFAQRVSRRVKALDAQHERDQQDIVAAQRAEKKHQAILNASLDAMITIDQHGTVIDYNHAAEEIFGWSAAEISGRNMAEYIIPETLRDAHQEGMTQYLNTGKGAMLGKRMELLAQRKNGETFPIEIAISALQTGDAIEFTAFIRDITRRRRYETELRIAAHAFESEEAILITDRDGHIIRVNQAFSRITGYAAHEVIGHRPNILSSGQQNKHFYQQLWQELEKTGRWSGEITNRRKNGELFAEHLNINAVLNKHGKASHYVAHFVDMTELKRNEDELLRARQQAEQANEAKSRFLASMSHEIRTPMNGVLGVLGLLKKTPLNSEQQSMVKTARESGEHLLTIINDILDFSKMEANKLSLENADFAIHTLFQQVHELLLPQAQNKSLQLSYRIDEDVPSRLNGDADRLRQILINLINNAIKFTVKGHIDVNAMLLQQQGEQVSLRLQVQDTGIGIAEDEQAQLFEEFTMADQSLARKQEGAGLGLAICKRLVTLMEGDIGVISQQGHGSTFYVDLTLPVAISKAEDDTAATTLLKPKAGLRILLAEDNSANQFVFKSILDAADLLVDVAADGEEAVAACQQRPYDLILMDISMPRMDGMQATQIIRQLPGGIAQVPIVAITAHALDGDRERFLTAGMNDCLTKPLQGDKLLSCIAQWTASITDAAQPIQHNPEQPPEPAEPAEPAEPYVNSGVLQQLAKDTSAALIPKLCDLFIQDSQQRLQALQHALANHDVQTLEFETHTLGSSAAAHGVTRLCQQCREIERLCRQQDYDTALELASTLAQTAQHSFDQLQQHVESVYGAALDA